MYVCLEEMGGWNIRKTYEGGGGLVESYESVHRGRGGGGGGGRKSPNFSVSTF